MDPKKCALPKRGDLYRCDECGLTFVCTADCKCDDAGDVCLKCCDQEMTKVVDE